MYTVELLHRNGEEHQLVGMFDSADAAARAYDQAALKMHGPEAYTNFLCKCCCSAQMLHVLAFALVHQGPEGVQEGSGRGGRGQEKALGGVTRGFSRGRCCSTQTLACCVGLLFAQQRAGGGGGGRVDRGFVTDDLLLLWLIKSAVQMSSFVALLLFAHACECSHCCNCTSSIEH